jgi:hypothetical protein
MTDDEKLREKEKIVFFESHNLKFCITLYFTSVLRVW